MAEVSKTSFMSGFFGFFSSPVVTNQTRSKLTSDVATSTDKAQEVSQSILQAQPARVGYHLNLCKCVDLNNGAFLSLCKHIKNIVSLNLHKTTISETEWKSALPVLKNNSPNLESLNISWQSYSQDVLKLIVSTFPRLKEINVDWLILGSMPATAFFDILAKWIKTNPSLESFICPTNDFTEENIDELFDNFPSTLQKLEIGFSFVWLTNEKLAQKLEKLSKKCGPSLKTLYFNSDDTQSYLDAKILASLPKLFPNLTELKFRCGTNQDLTSSVVKETYLQWKDMKHLSFQSAEMRADDLIELLNHFKNLETFIPGTGCKEQDLKKIAPVLIQNSGSTLKHLELNYIFNSKAVDEGLQAIQPILANLHTFEFLWNEMTNANLNLIVNSLGENLKKFGTWLSSDYAITRDNIIQAFLTIAQRCPNIEDLTLFGPLFNEGSSDRNKDNDTIPYAFKNLKTLSFQGVKPEFFFVNLILPFIETNPNLEMIDLAGLVGMQGIEDFKREFPDFAMRVAIRT